MTDLILACVLVLQAINVLILVRRVDRLEAAVRRD